MNVVRGEGTFVDRARELYRTSFPASGWHFEDARFLAMRMPVDAKVAARFLPFGLRMDEPTRATLFVARFPESVAVGSAYTEAGLFLHVRRGRTAGIHCPWIIVSDDIALVLGRELLGYPKKLGDIAFDVTGEEARAVVTRKGTRIFELSARIGGVDRSAPPLEGLPTYNVIGPMGASLQWLIRFQAEEEIIESRRAAVDLKLFSAPRDPIAELGFGSVEAAHYYRIKLGGSGFPLPVMPVGPRFWIHNYSLRSR